MTAKTIGLPQAVADRIQEIAARHGISRVRFFGSHARGDAQPGSDVDLLIQLDSDRGCAGLLAFCEEAERVLGRRADVVTEDALSPHIREHVLAEAVPL